MKRAACILFLFVAATAAAQQKRAFTIEDIYRVKSISDLTLSPDERSLLFTVATTDLARGKRSTRIWMMNIGGSNARPLTQGDGDSSPRISPDGQQVAFIRENNLFLLPLTGGEPRQLTHLSTSVSDLLWPPNSQWIAFSSDVYPECGADDAAEDARSVASDRLLRCGPLAELVRDGPLLHRASRMVPPIPWRRRSAVVYRSVSAQCGVRHDHGQADRAGEGAGKSAGKTRRQAAASRCANAHGRNTARTRQSCGFPLTTGQNLPTNARGTSIARLGKV